MSDDLSPSVAAFLEAHGLLLRTTISQSRPDQLVKDGWYTLPNGERGMAVRTAAGGWRLHRTVATYAVRPWDGALLRYLDAYDAHSPLALTDWTVVDLIPDPWVRGGATRPASPAS